MRILSPSTLSNFNRAVVQKDFDETASICNKLFDVDEPMNYQDDALRESYGCYVELKKLLEMYRTFPPSPLLLGAVHFAAATGSMEELKKIEHPSLLNMVDQKGLTPLHYAIFHKQKDAIVYLAKRCDLSYLTPVGDSYLHVASLQGDRELLNFFLHLKLDPNLKNQLGMTPGHFWALASTDLTGLKRLYQAGAKLDECNESLPLTAVQLHILKVLEASPDPLTKADIKLLAMNVLKAVAAGLLLVPQEFGFYTNFISFWGLMAFREIAGLFQQVIVDTMVPQDLSLLKQTVGIKGVLQTRLSHLLSGGRIPDGVLAGSTTVVVASNAFSRLANSSYASASDRLIAGGVHLLNLGASLLDCYFAYNPFNEFARLWAPDRLQVSRLMKDLDKDPNQLDPSSRLQKANNAVTIFDPSYNYEKLSQELVQVKEDSRYGTLLEFVRKGLRQIESKVDVSQHPEMYKKDGLYFKAEQAATFLVRTFFKETVIRPGFVPAYEEFVGLSDIERLKHFDLNCQLALLVSPSNELINAREQECCYLKTLMKISPELTKLPKDELPTAVQDYYRNLLAKLSVAAPAPSDLTGKKLEEWQFNEKSIRDNAQKIADEAIKFLGF